MLELGIKVMKRWVKGFTKTDSFDKDPRLDPLAKTERNKFWVFVSVEKRVGEGEQKGEKGVSNTSLTLTF